MSSKKLKIIVLSHSSELGGAERSMIDLFDYWDKHFDIEPHFIIRKPLKNMVPELKHRGWKYYPIYYTNWSQRNPSVEAQSIHRNARYNAEAVGQIEELIDKVNPDIVMTNTIVSPWAAIAAHFKAKPHVWFVREYGDIDHKHVFEMGREKLLEDISTMSEMIVVNSQTLGSHIAQYVDKNKISTLYTPFDIPKLVKKSKEPVDSPYKYEESLKIVITGRIAPSKGQEEAVRAVGLLNKKGYITEICVIGSPSQPEDANGLNIAIKEWGIEDKVHLVGNQPNPLKFIALADIGIMASQQEAFGRVTCEYMMLGKPVVGANSGATPEIIDNEKNGYLYVKDDEKDLVDKLMNYAKNEKLRTKHGIEAKEKIQKMMSGRHTAESLFEKIKILPFGGLDKTPALHFTRKWLDYPLIAEQYIKDSKSISIKLLFKQRLRARAKWAYLKITKVVRHEK